MSSTATLARSADATAIRNAAAIKVRPKAYSYVRWSTPQQAKGDSLNRQLDKARAYVRERGYELDETLNFRDAGISAYRGRNVLKGALGDFLRAVQEGIIARGSYLIVESLDRISRETVNKAATTLQMIVAEGVNLVDLEDGGRVYSEDTFENDQTAFLIMAVRFMRANMESRIKGDRVGKAYETKRREATERLKQGRPFTRMLPAWLRWNEEIKTIEAHPERAEVLQSIFEKASVGWGQHRIAHWLNEKGVPTFGGIGKQRKAEHWNRSYIKKLLGNRAVIGTFTPQQRTKNKDGKRERNPLEAIDGYFPAVIDHDVFERVASRTKATAARGRNVSIEPASIFAGVLKCARCGGVVTRVSKGAYVYLVCSQAHRKGGCRYAAVPYRDVELAFRHNANAIIRSAPRGKGAEEIDAQIEKLETVVSVLTDESYALADAYAAERNEELRQRLWQKTAELNEAKEKLKALRVKRNTEVAPYVHRRLVTLLDTVKHKPFNVAEVNKALKEAVSKIVLDPEAGRFAVYWHHANEPTGDVPFFSRHSRVFDSDDVDRVVTGGNAP
jgi:DNA invertase Pin-like site-specific DNA recombinase